MDNERTRCILHSLQRVLSAFLLINKKYAQIAVCKVGNKRKIREYDGVIFIARVI